MPKSNVKLNPNSRLEYRRISPGSTERTTYSETRNEPSKKLKLSIKWLRKRHYTILLCSMNGMVAYITRICISVAIIPMSVQFKWNSSTSGFVLSSFFYGYVATQILGGYLSTKFGGKVVLNLGNMIWSICTILIPILSKNMLALSVCRILMGASQGVAFPAIAALFAKHVPSHEQTRANAMILAFTYIGAIIGNVFSAQIIGVFGWESVFYVFGALSLLWSIPWSLHVPPEPSGDGFTRLDDEEDIDLEELKVGFNSSEWSPIHSVESDDSMEVPKRTNIPEVRKGVPWRDIFRQKPVWALIIAQFCQSWSFWLVVTWMPRYYQDLFNVDIKDLGYFTIIPYFVQGIVAIFIGSLSDYLTYKLNFRKIFIRRYMQATSMIGMSFFMILASASATTVIQGMTFLTLSMAMYNLSAAGMAVNHLDIAPDYAALVYGIGNTAGQVPGTIGVWSTGLLLDITNKNWNVVFSLAAVISVTGSIFWSIMCGAEPVVSRNV